MPPPNKELTEWMKNMTQQYTIYKELNLKYKYIASLKVKR